MESVALTVYNSDLSLIRELRPFTLDAGVQTLLLSEVSGQLKPETVHLNLPSGPAVSLLEQNYDYDLVSSDKLLEKFIGKDILLDRRREGHAKDGQAAQRRGRDGGRDRRAVAAQPAGAHRAARRRGERPAAAPDAVVARG